MNYPEQQMLKILNRDLLSNPMYVINNLHIYDWESDFLAITRSLYAYEVEVKMSKQDFFNDFKKDKKHKVLKDGIIKVGGVISYPPNYFYYACPPNMIDVSEVPSYAGLIYVDVSKKLSLRDRTWVCPACGAINDRDVLAARNILRKGISELESMGNSGCRNAGVPYVCIQESHLL